jgi:hypothetical protein
MSSTMNLSTLSVSDLLAQRSAIDAEIFKQTGGTSVGAATDAGGKGKKAKGEKKVSSRTGKSTVYGDFSSKIQKEHAEAIKAFKEANPDLKGAHMTWVGTYKKEHEDEYLSFKADWDVAHPKVEAEEVEEVEGEEATEPVKPKKTLSPEHLAKLKAGREAAKAKKDAEKAAAEEEGRSDAPIALPAPEAKKAVKKAKKAEAIVTPVVEVAAVEVAAVTEEDEVVELPFKLGAQTYIRLGSSKADGNHAWASTDLWLSKKGKRGAYAGELMEDGSINTDAEEPNVE